MLESERLFTLIVVVTLAACTYIVTDELRRRALDARVLSALWFLEPGGNLALLRFFFGNSIADADLRRSLERLRRARFVRVERAAGDLAYGVTPEGLYSLERGGLGMRGLVESFPRG